MRITQGFSDFDPVLRVRDLRRTGADSSGGHGLAQAACAKEWEWSAQELINRLTLLSSFSSLARAVLARQHYLHRRSMGGQGRDALWLLRSQEEPEPEAPATWRGHPGCSLMRGYSWSIRKGGSLLWGRPPLGIVSVILFASTREPALVVRAVECSDGRIGDGEKKEFSSGGGATRRIQPGRQGRRWWARESHR